MKAKNLHQSVRIKATPHELYESIVDPRRHARFTGASARLERRPGGKFAHYDGSLEGRVLDLRPDERVVLAWRSSDWPEGHYSIAEFDFTGVPGGTRLDFWQFGIPEANFEDIRDGWKQYYWEPLKAFHEE